MLFNALDRWNQLKAQHRLENDIPISFHLIDKNAGTDEQFKVSSYEEFISDIGSKDCMAAITKYFIFVLPVNENELLNRSIGYWRITTDSTKDIIQKYLVPIPEKETKSIPRLELIDI